MSISFHVLRRILNLRTAMQPRIVQWAPASWKIAGNDSPQGGLNDELITEPHRTHHPLSHRSAVSRLNQWLCKIRLWLPNVPICPQTNGNEWKSMGDHLLQRCQALVHVFLPSPCDQRRSAWPFLWSHPQLVSDSILPTIPEPTMPTTAGKPPGNHAPNFRSVAGWNMMFLLIK